MDENLPQGYVPFNVQAIASDIVVKRLCLGRSAKLKRFLRRKFANVAQLRPRT
jgi:hypothetical protein